MATASAPSIPGSARCRCGFPSCARDLTSRRSSSRARLPRKALVTVIQEAWIGGVSTRRVDELVQAMGLSSISKRQVLQAVQGHRPTGQCLSRPTDRGRMAVSLARRHLPKVRDGGRIVSVAAIIYLDARLTAAT